MGEHFSIQHVPSHPFLLRKISTPLPKKMFPSQSVFLVKCSKEVVPLFPESLSPSRTKPGKCPVPSDSIPPHDFHPVSQSHPMQTPCSTAWKIISIHSSYPLFPAYPAIPIILSPIDAIHPTIPSSATRPHGAVPFFCFLPAPTNLAVCSASALAEHGSL